MKKISLVLALLLIFSLLASCNEGDTPPENTTTAATTTATTVTTTTAKPTPEYDITVGMTREEAVSLYKQVIVDRTTTVFDVILFEDTKGNNTLIQFSVYTEAEARVTKIAHYEKPTQSRSAFEQITVNTDLFEVIEKLGLPDEIESFYSQGVPSEQIPPPAPIEDHYLFKYFADDGSHLYLIIKCKVLNNGDSLSIYVSQKTIDG